MFIENPESSIDEPIRETVKTHNLHEIKKKKKKQTNNNMQKILIKKKQFIL